MAVDFARKSTCRKGTASTVLRRDNVRPQLEELPFGSVENKSVESVDVTDAVVRVEARSTARRAACPGCGCWSSRIHGMFGRAGFELLCKRVLLYS